MKQRTRTVVVSILAGGLAGLGGCGFFGDDSGNGIGTDGVNPPPPPNDDDATEEPEEFFYDNPPPPDPVTEGTLPDKKLPGDERHRAKRGDLTELKLKPMNGRHPEHGKIFRSGDDCFVRLPFPDDVKLTSWRPSPTQRVDCPEDMATFLWSQCYGGTISVSADGSICVCRSDGNPPPPPRYVHCPQQGS